MAKFSVVKDGDAVLRRISHPVKTVDDRIQKLMRNMAETMYAEQGVGLAAPQVGISKRVIVVDDGDGLLCLANPKIIEREGVQNGPEGCLSVPRKVGNVLRSQKIKVQALDYDGQDVLLEVEGFLARILQHEIDHLEGVLFTDKATDIEVE